MQEKKEEIIIITIVINNNNNNNNKILRPIKREKILKFNYMKVKNK